MTVIEDRPRTRVEGDVEPVTAEVLFAEARAHGRRRRNRMIVGIAIVAVAALAVGGGILWLGRPASPAPVRSYSIPRTADGFPTQFIAWDAPTKQSVGGIEVISSTTGKTIRTLVKNTNEPDPAYGTLNPLAYVVSGFDLSNDGRTMYFDSANEIESVATIGGAVTRVANGSEPMVSPDGNLLAFRQGGTSDSWPSFVQFGRGASFAIKQLLTGRVTRYNIPGVQPDQAVVASWLPDSGHLLVYASKFPVCHPGPACAIYPHGYPGWRDIAKVLDVATGKFTSASSRVAAALTETRTSQPELDGSSSTRNSVRISTIVTVSSAPTSEQQYTEVGTLDVYTGKVNWQYRTPIGFGFLWTGMTQLAGQDSGDHFILSGESSNDGSDLFSWSPAEHAAPKQIGATPRQLAVGSYWDVA